MKKKIMIVDDEEISLTMTEYILSTEYETVCASSGEEALRIFGRERPDLVLSDLRMPNMNGYELLSALNRMGGERVPFIFMTADENEDVESLGLENGALDFIKKPFRADVLLSRVGNILSMLGKIQGLKVAASTDSMTGCLNKASTESELAKICLRRQGALMMVDLDSFKLVNDIYGHAAGDGILIRFAEILRSAVRSQDIVGRLGGDEFVLFCTDVKSEDVIAKKSEFINSHIVSSAKELLGDDMKIPLGASIGCVFVPDEGEDYKTLASKADRALYNVKANGKHGFSVFRSSLPKVSQSPEPSGGIEGVIKILSERNRKPGAFFVPFEKFTVVYHFLSRFVENYHRRVWILMFSVENPDGDCRKVDSEAFARVIQSSLRKSDVATRLATGEFLVLLQNAEEHNVLQIIGRIMKRWGAEEKSDSTSVLVEQDFIRESRG